MTAEPAILGQLLAAHTVLQALPTEQRIAEFMSQALRLVPGVAGCGVCFPETGVTAGPWGDACSLRREGKACAANGRSQCGLAREEGLLVFPMETPQRIYSQLLLSVTDVPRFLPYEPFVSNFAGSVALTLENRRQRQELEEANARLRDSERDFQLLFEEMTSGFALHEVVLDAQGNPCDYRFLKVNSAYEPLTGLESGEVVGKTVLEVLPGLDRSWIETYGRVALEGTQVHFERYESALDRYYEVVAYSPRRTLFATIVTDITVRKQAEEVLSRTAAELEQAYQREHDIAEYLQRAMLPVLSEIPGIAMDLCYESPSDTALVGGDFYDVISLKEGLVAIAVGDVCGKGLPAATRMAEVRHTLRAYATLGQDPGDWLALANKGLAGQTSPHEYTTVALVILDPSDGTLHFALAGHPPPVLATRTGAKELRCEPGLPLGLDAATSYATGKAQMDEGSTLLLYSDGVSEARDSGGLFGTGQLLSASVSLASEPLPGAASRLVEQARVFAGGHLSDDAVVAVIRLQETVHRTD